MCPICPKCKEKIDVLSNIVSGTQRYDMFLESSGRVHYEGVDFTSDDSFSEWWCPECKESLFTSEDEAEKFLKDEDELLKLVAKKLKKSDTLIIVVDTTIDAQGQDGYIGNAYNFDVSPLKKKFNKHIHFQDGLFEAEHHY